jgi:hypothetical protein
MRAVIVGQWNFCLLNGFPERPKRRGQKNFKQELAESAENELTESHEHEPDSRVNLCDLCALLFRNSVSLVAALPRCVLCDLL